MKKIRLVFLVFLVLAGIVLAGCADQAAYRKGNALLAQGQVEQGIAKLEQAVKLNPDNPQYRLTLANQRALFASLGIQRAEAARKQGRISDAEVAYRQVQALDPDNDRAREGLAGMDKERQHLARVGEAQALFDKDSKTARLEALQILRSVLSEDPYQKNAAQLKTRIDEKNALEEQPEKNLAAALSASFRKPITLEFRDAPLKSVLEIIAHVAGLNFFYDKDIPPNLRVTVFAKNTTVDDALRVILVTNQLEQKILNANSLLIYPNTPQKIKDYQTLAVRSFYLTNADVKAVANTLKTILKTRDLVVDERLGMLIMRDTPEVIRMAERIVAVQDISDPEVMLEVEILEIKRSRLLELGIQWPNQLTLTPLPPLTLATLKHLHSPQIQADIGSLTINAQKEDQTGNILANPRIRVRNKEKAKIQIGDRVPTITTTSTATGFVSESINYIDVGLKLEVEPTIYPDAEVAIKINLEVSNLVREILSKSGALAYQIGTRGANTVLRLKDGETQILAGLISDEDRSSANKIPILGEFPIAGRLFGSQKDDVQRSEILLSITPRILRLLRRPALSNAEFESGTESSIGAPTLKIGVAQKEKQEAVQTLPKTLDAPANPVTPTLAAPSTEAVKADTVTAAPVPSPSPSPAPAP